MKPCNARSSRVEPNRLSVQPILHGHTDLLPEGQPLRLRCMPYKGSEMAIGPKRLSGTGNDHDRIFAQIGKRDYSFSLGRTEMCCEGVRVRIPDQSGAI